MKGIVLAGGSGTRLHPLTLGVSKQLMPVYDKPMIYYPISTLMWSGIRDILIISTPEDLPLFKKLLGDGKKYGCKFEYEVQESPNGLAEAFIIGAVPGIYFYDNSVIEIAKSIKPSKRGELEITDVNKTYLSQGKLKVSVLDKGTAWLDTGTFKSLMQASQFVQVIEERQGLKIGSIEAAAYEMGYIDKAQFKKVVKPLIKSGYGKHLLSLLSE